MTHDLSGIRVVTLAANLPGPVAAARLRALGAHVLKIEGPAGDPLATAAPDWYRDLTHGMEARVLDLKSASGHAAFTSTLDAADVLITAMRPTALRKLGLDRAVQDRAALSHVEIVGYDGARADEAGHDLTYQAEHGTLTPAAMPTIPAVDLLGAERAVAQTLLALRERERSGLGTVRRVVLDDAAADAGAAIRYGLFGEGALLGGADPAYGLYRALDGHLAVAALEPHFRSRLVTALGADDQAGLAREFGRRTVAEALELAARHDIPITEVRSAHTPLRNRELS